MLVHCIAIGDPATRDFDTLCGAPALSSSSISDLTGDITCEDCLVRLLARTHADLGVLLRQLGTRVIALRGQAESAVRRD